MRLPSSNASIEPKELAACLRAILEMSRPTTLQPNELASMIYIAWMLSSNHVQKLEYKKYM